MLGVNRIECGVIVVVSSKTENTSRAAVSFVLVLDIVSLMSLPCTTRQSPCVLLPEDSYEIRTRRLLFRVLHS